MDKYIVMISDDLKVKQKKLLLVLSRRNSLEANIA